MAKVMAGKEWQAMEPPGARFGRGAECFSQRSYGSSPSLSQPIYYSQDRAQLSPFLSNTQLSQPISFSQDQNRSAGPSPIPPHPSKQFQPGNGLLRSKLGRYMEPNQALPPVHPKTNSLLQEAEPAVFLQLINLITDLKTSMIDISKTTVSAIETIRQALAETQQQLNGAIETMQGFANGQSSQERDSQLVEKMAELITKHNAANELTQSVKETLQDSIAGIRRCIENEITQKIENLSQSLAAQTNTSTPDQNPEPESEPPRNAKGKNGQGRAKRQPIRKQVQRGRQKKQLSKATPSGTMPQRGRGRPRKNPTREAEFVPDVIECSVLDWFEDCSNLGDSIEYEVKSASHAPAQVLVLRRLRAGRS